MSCSDGVLGTRRVRKTPSTSPNGLSLNAWCKRRLPIALSCPFVASIGVLEQLRLRGNEQQELATVIVVLRRKISVLPASDSADGAVPAQVPDPSFGAR
jgi:hypothetical protein